MILTNWDHIEDLLDIGIPSSAMVRLGPKSTARTKPLGVREQKPISRKPYDFERTLNAMKVRTNGLADVVQKSVASFQSAKTSPADILDYLEYADEKFDFYGAFMVPTDENGMQRVGRKGKAIDGTYLIQQWISGNNGNAFQNMIAEEHKPIWQIPKEDRTRYYQRWKEELLKEMVEETVRNMFEYNEAHKEIERKKEERNCEIICSKRIIGCTTTAAAKYAQDLQVASPDVVLVEEAGEILESHILTALGENTEQLILIGDHQQLRPKANNYALSVEKGDGYDFNRSLFERLVLKGYPHQTLTEQHRMRPEISELVRALTYPDLTDAPGTLNRPDIRGLSDNVIFVNHMKPEDENPRMAAKNDGESFRSSKQNTYEAQMVLKCVRYLGQQGYGTDDLVILTPYLGQLSLLRDVLSAENDPLLNDLDSYELVRAGLVPASSARLTQKPIRLSTIGKKHHIPE